MKCDGSDWPELRKKILWVREQNDLHRQARQTYGPQVSGRDLRTVMAVYGLQVSDLLKMPLAQVSDPRTVRRWRSDVSKKRMPVDEFRAVVLYLQRHKTTAPVAGELTELIGPDWRNETWWRMVSVADDGSIYRVPAEV